MDQQSGSEFISQDSAGEFLSCKGLFFSMKLLEFMSKAIKLLLTELVGQSRNILPLAFSALASLLLASTEKAVDNIGVHRPPTKLIKV